MPGASSPGSGGSDGASFGVISTLNGDTSSRTVAATSDGATAQPRRRRSSALIAGTTSCMSPITA